VRSQPGNQREWVSHCHSVLNPADQQQPFWASDSYEMNCQIEHGAIDSDVGSPCSNRAVATCCDCGAPICSDCHGGEVLEAATKPKQGVSEGHGLDGAVGSPTAKTTEQTSSLYPYEIQWLCTKNPVKPIYGSG
jgi:hypothetical protein